MSSGVVPAKQLGEITKLPGLGTRFITLWAFHREGLEPLERKRPYESHMHNNRRLRDHGLEMQNWEPLSPVCDSCNRTFRELGGNIPLTSRNTTYNLVMVTPKNNVREARYFCWDCAASRETLVHVCGAPFRASIAEDGIDVFAFIAQTIYEDRLADEIGQPSLECHHRGNARIMSKYRQTIGGRLLSLHERGLFSGPIHPIFNTAHNRSNVSGGVVDTVSSAEQSPQTDSASNSQDSYRSFDSQLERQRRTLEVLARPEQKVFRTALEEAYDKKCAVTNCCVRDVLQAAHIKSVAEGGSDSVRNGILLRSDVHLLFDAGLIVIHPETMTVEVAPTLAGTEYESLEDNIVRLPVDSSKHPSRFFLGEHRKRAKNKWPI